MTVSLQQAYSILLSCQITLLHYKVYASLSRLGYKVFRHESCQPTDNEKKMNLISSENDVQFEESEGVKYDTGMVVDEVNEGVEGNSYHLILIKYFSIALTVHLMLITTKQSRLFLFLLIKS